MNAAARGKFLQLCDREWAKIASCCLNHHVCLVFCGLIAQLSSKLFNLQRDPTQ